MTAETNNKLRTLLLDIETTPSIGYVWEKYETDVIEFLKEWHIISFSVKWLGDKKAEVFSLPDFSLYKKDPDSDLELCKKLREYLDSADLIIAHNGDRFDLKKINARLVINGLTPPSPYKTIDTLKIARKHFGFNSNKLNDLGITLGLGAKVETGGFKLWKGCMAGDMKSWKLMTKYNLQDVQLLEKVYLKLRPWASAHPNVTTDNDLRCHCCGSYNVQKRGYNYSKLGKAQRWQCLACSSWSSGSSEKK